MAERKYDIPPEFLDAADRFVTLANELGDQNSRDWVRAVLMYAAARYNAFAWLTREGREEQTLEQAAAYFSGFGGLSHYSWHGGNTMLICLVLVLLSLLGRMLKWPYA
jgi:hypothetical protein